MVGVVVIAVMQNVKVERLFICSGHPCRICRIRGIAKPRFKLEC